MAIRVAFVQDWQFCTISPPARSRKWRYRLPARHHILDIGINPRERRLEGGLLLFGRDPADMS
jgi:hypothetical protein